MIRKRDLQREVASLTRALDAARQDLTAMAEDFVAERNAHANTTGSLVDLGAQMNDLRTQLQTVTDERDNERLMTNMRLGRVLAHLGYEGPLPTEDDWATIEMLIDKERASAVEVDARICDVVDQALARIKIEGRDTFPPLPINSAQFLAWREMIGPIVRYDVLERMKINTDGALEVGMYYPTWQFDWLAGRVYPLAVTMFEDLQGIPPMIVAAWSTRSNPDLVHRGVEVSPATWIANALLEKPLLAEVERFRKAMS